MEKNTMGKISLFLKFFLGLIIILVLTKLYLVTKENSEINNKDHLVTLEDFAKCLSERGTVMYGVDSCTYCQAQKKMFGSSFAKIHYINCEFEKEQCQKEGITHYPVWSYQGKKFTGTLLFDQLATLTSCPLPAEY
jgi:hypothetical protein